MNFDEALTFLSTALRQQMESRADNKFEEDLAQPITTVAETFIRDVHSIAASLQTIAYVQHKTAVNDGIISE